MPSGHVRASDEERERVAEVLRSALGEGRLTLGEVDERLAQVYAARTHAELVPITADLPGADVVLAGLAQKPPMTSLPQPQDAQFRVAAGPESGHATAIFGGVERKGRWTMPRLLWLTTIFGGADVDLTTATLADRVVRVRACAIFGGAQITVPQGITVRDSVTAIFGGVDNKANEAEDPGAPIVEITGLVLFGGLEIARPKERKRKLRR